MFPAEELRSGVISVFVAGGAYAALKSGGAVTMWGKAQNGGNGCVSSSDSDCETSVTSQLSSGVTSLRASTQQEDASCATKKPQDHRL